MNATNALIIVLVLLAIPIVIYIRINFRDFLKNLFRALYLNIFAFAIYSIVNVIFTAILIETNLLLMNLITVNGFLLFLIDWFVVLLALKTFDMLKRFLGF
jgi:hypothetical protein